MNSETIHTLLEIHLGLAVSDSSEVDYLVRTGLIRSNGNHYETTFNGERVVAGAVKGASTVL